MFRSALVVMAVVFVGACALAPLPAEMDPASLARWDSETGDTAYLATGDTGQGWPCVWDPQLANVDLQNMLQKQQQCLDP